MAKPNFLKIFKDGLVQSIVHHHPVHLIIFITGRCNARCRMCFNWQVNLQNPQEFTLEEIKKLSSNMDDLSYVVIGGGEPFLHKDIAEICREFYFNNKVQYITIPTNGLLPDLILERTKKIIELCPKAQVAVNLSIDDIGARHDEIRGIKGCFEKVLILQKKLSQLEKEAPNFELRYSVTFSKFNQDTIRGTYQYIKDKFGSSRVGLQLVRGNCRESLASDILIDKYINLIREIDQDRLKQAKNLKEQIIASRAIAKHNLVIDTYQKKKQLAKCFGGILNVIIDEKGNIYPCEILGQSIGNLKEANFDFKKIWNSEKADETRKYIKAKKCYCTHECNIDLNVLYCPFTSPYNFLREFLKLKFRK